MSKLDGWSQWSVAFFQKLFVGNKEIVYDLPGRIRYPRPAIGNSLTNLAGTSIHQAFWLGGDAPINLVKIPFELDFQPDAEEECFALQRFYSLCMFNPQPFFPGVWIDDFWYIPARNTGQTAWQTSRNLAYDIVDINDATFDYMPKAFIDDVEQDIIQEGDPVEGEVKVIPDVESSTIILPSTISGTYLRFFYPPKFYICTAELVEEIPDTDEYTLGLSLTEHLPNRNYNFTIP
jgi:hypothetical protein